MSVYKVYQDVIDDVIGGVRDLFTEDGVDEQVLQELRQTWEAKLLATKAVSQEPKKPDYLAGAFVKPQAKAPVPAQSVVHGQAPAQPATTVQVRWRFMRLHCSLFCALFQRPLFHATRF